MRASFSPLPSPRRSVLSAPRPTPAAVHDLGVTRDALLVKQVPGLCNNRSNVLERFYVSHPEFYVEFDFNRDYKIDVIKRVPVRNIFPPSLHRKHDRIV